MNDSASADRFRQLRTHLRCTPAGGVQFRERQACFVRIVRLLNDWPAGEERERAFAEARTELAGWNSTFRETTASWGSNTVQGVDGTVFDTLSLVGSLVVKRPASDSPAPNLSALLRSPHGAEIQALHVFDVPLSLPELARGPACGKLLGLELNQAIDAASDWSALGAWSGLGTLQGVSVLGGNPRSLDTPFWDLMNRVPGLHSLVFSEQTGARASSTRSVSVPLSLTGSMSSISARPS